MIHMDVKLYKITPISNLHVGSGAVNFGVVDNLIQRDALTGLPVVNASSLKGALREHFTRSTKNVKIDIGQIFGSPVKGSNRSPGSTRFFDANLLAIPVRSDKVPFFLATCPSVIKDLISKVTLFKIDLDGLDVLLEQLTNAAPLSVFNKGQEDALVEDLDGKTGLVEDLDGKKGLSQNISKLSPIFGNAPLLLVSDAQFKTLCDDNHLPVIARNYLNNGKSENLFYEQVIPRSSVLYFLMIEDKYKLPLDNEVIQIGANASVGYGFCLFNQLVSKA